MITGLLQNDSPACIESGLHGLGEWRIYYPDIETTINDFLQRSPGITPGLRAYAERAIDGRV